ncbi:ABC-type sugar transport system, ATPase component [Moorella thermoacetica Y72]|uniref:ABC-type sugar transport system, ATPase component n=1 Tax=Moorella thermoacetica Y72 TaxID=1325331 RepID=A0A0S6UCV5_NEOTH|nr:sugar ABC transporter ATP-binding protein [Moorella thermoacetica]GAF25222.1 ABC-type sugar transport system, ATPase component [Moorella thermoacetica Y72]
MDEKVDYMIRLKLQDITKKFPGVQALNRVSFDCLEGEVHALVGENGAGKSTLMKILSGVYRPDEGTILLEGQTVEFKCPRDAQVAGIAMIHQELSLAQGLTVAENIFMGHLPQKKLGFVNSSKINQKTIELLQQVGLQGVDPWEKINNLNASQRQLIEIAKALSLKAKILIMDEPTSSLSLIETQNLLNLVSKLKNQGITIIYISHRLEEVFAIADRITVLRDGSCIATVTPKSVIPADIVAMMVGRKTDEEKIYFSQPKDEILLEVKDLTKKGKFSNINFSLKKGEILGVAGLVGSGRSDLASALFGIESDVKGLITINGNKVVIRSPRDAIREGIAFVPEDRKLQALFLTMAVKDNIVIAAAEKNNKFGFINKREEETWSREYVERLSIRLHSIKQQIQYLSGGNQQKAIIARWLLCNPKILILDEPTRGIDVGAKQEIYQLIKSLAEKGVGVILISSELPEIMMLSNRILVMRQGRIVGELERSEATQEKVMLLATGQATHVA